MNSHDVARDRGSVESALSKVKAKALVVGISSDRLFPISGQKLIAEHLGGELVGGKLHVIDSEFGHDGFLIEMETVGPLLKKLLEWD
jgi:homoserine O-acetyltransferase